MITHLNLMRSAFAVSLLAMAAACGGASSTGNQSASSTNMQEPMGNRSAQAMPSGPFSQAEMQMHERMTAATGANASETWARKMIAHHRGAVDMSEVLIRQGGNPQVVAMARRTAEDQRREIAHLEAMLRGEGMPAAGAPAAREPSPGPKATPTPRPAQRDQTTPRPARRPAPSPTPTPTCAPEHRAAGHC